MNDQDDAWRNGSNIHYKMPARSTVAPVLLSLAFSFFIPSLAYSRECTCDDLGRMRNRTEAAGKAEQAWKEIFAWARGLRTSPPLPTTNDEMNVRFGELMNASANTWDSIMSQPVTRTSTPPTIGGLNANGEPVIDNNFASENCDTIVEAVRLHEARHEEFYTSLLHVSEVLFPSSHKRLRAESEVVSYRAEKEFLQAKADELEKKCTGWSGQISCTCEYTGDEGQDRVSSWSNYSVTRITIDLNNGTGTATGHTEMKRFKIQKQGVWLPGGGIDLITENSSKREGTFDAISEAMVGVEIDKTNGTYYIKPDYLPMGLGKAHYVDCIYDNCTEKDLPFPIETCLKGYISGQLDSPNHLHGSQSNVTTSLGERYNGKRTCTLTWDLAQRGTSQ
jgi:hypothetical protein